jgi:hypothetical protein
MHINYTMEQSLEEKILHSETPIKFICETRSVNGECDNYLPNLYEDIMKIVNKHKLPYEDKYMGRYRDIETIGSRREAFVTYSKHEITIKPKI